MNPELLVLPQAVLAGWALLLYNERMQFARSHRLEVAMLRRFRHYTRDGYACVSQADLAVLSMVAAREIFACTKQTLFHTD